MICCCCLDFSPVTAEFRVSWLSSSVGRCLVRMVLCSVCQPLCEGSAAGVCQGRCRCLCSLSTEPRGQGLLHTGHSVSPGAATTVSSGPSVSAPYSNGETLQVWPDVTCVCLCVHPSLCASVHVYVHVYGCLSGSVSVSVSVHVSICVSAHLPLCPCLSGRLSVGVSFCPSVCVFVHPSIYLSMCMSMFLHPSVHPSMCLSVQPSVLVSVHPCDHISVCS